MASKKDKDRLNKIFKQLDLNSDGLLTLDEL
jgi:Ca2+-binding EF-hand superfamily protein